jgi:SAM-dependent methyltransferase
MKKNINSFLDAMVSSKQLTKDVFDLWYERFTTVIDPNIAPWDPWLFQEWEKKERLTFDDLADYYNDDAWVCQQVRMLTSWKIEDVSLLPYLSSGTRVLDFGCGHGRDGIGCAQNGATVTFADISPRLLKGVKEYCDAHDVEASTFQITEAIPKIPGEYDIIICKDVLEHVKYPVEILEQLTNSLVPGGVMWMTVFFNGHELSPYHLPEHYHLDHGTRWLDICRRFGLEPIEGTDRFYRKVR